MSVKQKKEFHYSNSYPVHVTSNLDFSEESDPKCPSIQPRCGMCKAVYFSSYLQGQKQILTKLLLGRRPPKKRTAGPEQFNCVKMSQTEN